MNDMFLFHKNALQGVLTNPLCAEYKAEWRACGDDKEKLFNLAVRRQSIPYVMAHAHEGVGLTKEYLGEEFADFINGAYTAKDVDGVKGDYTTQMFSNYKGNLYEMADTTAFMWSEVDITLAGCKCPVLYVGCSSEVHLFLDGYNSVHVYLFDDSKLYVEDSDESCEVVVYKYSEGVEVVRGKYALSPIKEFTKKMRL